MKHPRLWRQEIFKEIFLAEKGGKGDLAFKRKLQATVGSLCKIHNCWMNGKCWSILTWGARVPAYDMAAGAPQRHKSKRKLFRQLTRNVEPKMLENWGVLSWRTFYLLRLEGLWRSRRLELPPTDDPPSQSPVCTNYFIHCTSLHFTLHQVTYIVIVSYSDIWIWIKSVLLYMLWNHSWIYRTK